MEANINDFYKLDIRVGTIIMAQEFPKAQKKAYQLTIDFGALGIKKSSAQITEQYKIDDLIGKQIIAIVNLPKKQIANFYSEVLVLGIYHNDSVVLIAPLKKVNNGDKIG